VVRLRVPWLMTARGAIDTVRALNPRALVDHNHYYRPQRAEPGCRTPACTAALVRWPAGAGRCGPPALIGMIDTAVDREHPALRGSRIESVTVRREDARPSGSAHGTAVASVLVGAAEGAVPGLLPQARLIAVDAFHRGFLSGDRMDVFDLIRALDLLVRRDVRVVNLSFAGAPNLLLEDAVQRLHRRGTVLVAAVGNEGPAAPSLYPAAYPGVVAVTAVDRDLEVYYRASRGKHVDFSAPGVDVLAAAPARRGEPGATQAHSGTSFATPFVTAAVALVLARAQARDADGARRVLASRARDLGAPGLDPVFGFGLVQAVGLCGPGSVKR
jgi:subtilisin family serine protease